MLSTGRRLQYKGFAFEIARDSIYQLPKPTYRNTNTTINGLSDYETICYVFNEDIVTAKQFQAICTMKILLQKILPKIRFKDELELDKNVLGTFYNVNELTALLRANLSNEENYVRYQQPLLPYSKNEIYSNICKYAQRLHYERQLHFEGVVYGAMKINSTIDISNRYSYKEVFKMAYKSYCNVLVDRPQKLLGDDLTKALTNGGNIRGKQKKDESSIKKNLILKYLDECMKSNAKVDYLKLSGLTYIPKSTLYRLVKELHTSN